MTRSKNTKRALTTSVLSMLLCVAMLIGSTFAWFTDNATTGVNSIQAGTLDVDIIDTNGESLAGNTLDFVDDEGNELTDILWEPNCTYNLQDFAITNLGNLALKYQIVLNGLDADEYKLMEVITVTATDAEGNTVDFDTFEGSLMPNGEDGDTSSYISISLHMDENAGNEYQGLSIDDISITVYATQYTYESDSFDDQYDKYAEYDFTTIPEDATQVESTDELSDALSGGDTYVVLAGDIEISEDITVGDETTLNLAGNTVILDDGAAIALTDGAAIAGGTIETTGDGAALIVTTHNDVSVISNMTIVGDGSSGSIGIYISSNGEVTGINNCTISNVDYGVKINKGNYGDSFGTISNSTITGNKEGVQLWYSTGGTIDNCVITGGDIGVGAYGLAADNHPTSVTVTNSTLIGTARFGFSLCDTACWDGGAYYEGMPESTATVENCTLIGGVAGACIDQSVSRNDAATVPMTWDVNNCVNGDGSPVTESVDGAKTNYN